MHALTSVPLVLVYALIHLYGVLAYIPASPTNDTNVQGGPNVTDISKLHLQWYSNGSYWENISYQLAGSNSTGVSQGALVHFSEAYVQNSSNPTATPWIAMIACDFNATNSDLNPDQDIFTLIQENGAIAALLYSAYSQGCAMNAEYLNPDLYTPLFDVFSTQSLNAAKLIQYQFGQFGARNESIYGYYDSQMLNESAAVIAQAIAQDSAVVPGYLFATLQAYNATSTPTSGDGDGGGGTSGSSSTSSSSSTGLAMIILYVITGCVSALFCVVIISGAIRAIRHPERYGPRSAPGTNGGYGYEQSRARGITRAILDTFPVVKFGRTDQEAGLSDRDKDLEARRNNDGDGEDGSQDGIKMTQLEVVGSPPTDGEAPNVAHLHLASVPSSETVVGDSDVLAVATHQRSSQTSHSRSNSGESSRPSLRTTERMPQTSTSAAVDVVPEAIGRDTCPICILDFEEGDDLRILPCEGKHQFHQHCVDPWLLELSSSCPICRQDFQALETIISGGSEDGHQRESSYPPGNWAHGATPGNRFSRYLRFARRRRHHENPEQYDPTDPYMPTAPEAQL